MKFNDHFFYFILNLKLPADEIQYLLDLKFSDLKLDLVNLKN